MLTECFMHEHTIIQFILFNLFTIHSRIPGANGCVYLLSSALYEVAYLFWHVYCVVCTHQTIIRIPLNWMFFSPDDRMVRILHINRFTGIWLIRATSIRSGDYLNKCKIWHARQSTEFHSNIDWLLSFALYLFMVSTRAAEKNAITLKFHKFQIDIASYITGSIDFSWKLLFLLSCVDFT